MEDPPDLFQVIAGKSDKRASKKKFGKRQLDEEKQKPAKRRKTGKSSTSQANQADQENAEISWTPALLHRSAFNAGMLVLGRIKTIGKRGLRISLLNNIEGEVPISELNDSLTELLLQAAKNDEDSKISLNSMFRVGEFVIARVRADIASDTQERMVPLTMRPQAIYEDNAVTRSFSSFSNSLVVQGAVRSVEDHGYLIELGFSTGFLRRGETQHKVGELLLCAIDTTTDRVLPLTAQREAVAKCFVASDAQLPLEWLVPGMKVRGRIAAVLSTGLRVSFGPEGAGSAPFECYVHRSHMRANMTYTVGQLCAVRLALVDRQARRLVGSMLKHVLSLDAASDEVARSNVARRGVTLRDGTVTRVEPHALHVRFPCPQGAVDVLVPKVHLVDAPSKPDGDGDEEEEQDLDKLLYGETATANGKQESETMHVGQKISQCRVLAYSSFDGLAIGTLRQSLLNEKYFTLDDVQAAETVTCTVQKFAESNESLPDQPDSKVRGIVVALSRFVYGFVPRTHLADVPHVAHPERSFTVGQKLTCRVLKVSRDDADAAQSRNRLVLTNKRTLVRSRLPALCSFEQLQIGLITDCYVKRVAADGNGLIVGFFNNVTAFVPLAHCGVSRLALAEARLDTLFRPGSLARCVLLAVDHRTRKALASFRLDAVGKQLVPPPSSTNSGSADTQQPVAFDERLFDVRIGERLLVVGFERRNDSAAGFDVRVQLQPDASASQPKVLLAFLPKVHLSDFAELNDAWFRMCAHSGAANLAFAELLKGGHEAVCFGKSSRQLIISMRQNILDYCRMTKATSTTEEGQPDHDGIRQSFEQLQVDDLVPGCITRVVPFGVFAELLGQFVGLVPTHYLTDSFRANRTDSFARFFTPGDSLLFRIRGVKMDRGKPRCLLDSRISSLRSSPSINSAIDRLAKSIVEKRHFASLCRVNLNDSVTSQSPDASWLTRCALQELAVCHLSLRKNAAQIDAQLNGTTLSVSDLILLDADGPIEAATLLERHANADSIECDCVLLNVNKANGQVSIGINDTLVRDVRARRENKATVVRVGQHISSRVLLVTADFVLVELLAHALGKLAYLPARRQPNDVLHRNVYVVGQSNRIIISRLEPLDESVNGGQLVFGVAEQFSEPDSASKSARDAKTRKLTELRGVTVGSQMNARVAKVRALFVKLAVGAQTGQLHFTDLRELDELAHGRQLGKQLNLDEALKRAGIESGRLINVTVCHIRQRERVARSASIVFDCSTRRTPLDVSRLAPGDLVPAVITGCSDDVVHLMLSRTARAVCYALQAADSVRKLENLRKYFRVRFAILARVVRRLEDDAFEVAFVPERRLVAGEETTARVRSAHQTPDGRHVLRVALANKAIGLIHLANSGASPQLELGAFVRVKIIHMEPLRRTSADNDSRHDDDDETVKLFYHTVLTDSDADLERILRQRLVSRSARHRRRSDSIGSTSLIENNERSRLLSSSELPSRNEAAQERRRNESISSNLEPSSGRACLSAHAARIDWHVDEAQPSAAKLSKLQDADESESDEQDVDAATKTEQVEAEDGDDEMAAEKRLMQIERAIADGRREPQTPDDFERMVRETPNASAIWVRYAAHHAEQGRVAAARAVLERALTTMAYREQAEKRNCWFALLNLEAMFGTPESLDAAFARAVQHCEPYATYSHLVRVLEKAGQLDAAERRFDEALRRYGHQEVRFWNAFGAFCYRNKRVDKARAALQRSVKVLSKREHVNLIVKFAEFEFKFADAERGVTLFESVLASYPKRTDVWSVYIDMLVHASKLEEARAVFERILSQQAQPGCPFTKKQLLSVIDKYIRFEERFAPPAKRRDVVSRIRQRALSLDSL